MLATKAGFMHRRAANTQITKQLKQNGGIKDNRSYNTYTITHQTANPCSLNFPHKTYIKNSLLLSTRTKALQMLPHDQERPLGQTHGKLTTAHYF